MASWAILPAEMKLAVLDLLDNVDVRALSTTERTIYPLCIPSLFKKIALRDWQAISQFLANVPSHYLSHTISLELCTQLQGDSHHFDPPTSRTEAVMSILTASPRLQNLVLKLAGPLEKRVISCFAPMHRLTQLSISNCADENLLPISERFVVSVAASIPRLEELSLNCISRSQMYVRDEIIPHYVPLVLGDNDIPDHPTLGGHLNLPSLLRIPSLKKLNIHGTHLGDACWETVDVRCKLEVLDLGSCCHENDDFNRVCTERIMAAVGPTVDEFSLTTSVSDSKFAEPSITPLQKLRKLHISPFFPVDNIVDTVSNLAGSPIESLSVQCYEDDVVDTCSAMEEFLSLRVERGPQFYDRLKMIHVTVTANDDDMDSDPLPVEEANERSEAVKRLQDFCDDLKLASEVGKVQQDENNTLVGKCTPSPATSTHKCYPCGGTPAAEADGGKYPLSGRFRPGFNAV